MLFSLFKHYLELYITDTVLKVSRSLYCFTTSISHGVENYRASGLLLHLKFCMDAHFFMPYPYISHFLNFYYQKYEPCCID